MDTTVLVIKREPVGVACPITGRVDLALVHRLARLTLEARRGSAVIGLYGVSPELRVLLELCGLADLLPERRGGTC